MRVLMTGGGTAGHINPALAIADELKKRYPDTEFLFVGATGRMETELVPKAGYPIKTVTVKGFSRKKSLSGIAHNFSAVYHAVVSSFTCKKILKDFKPDVAVGTGGYVCGPILREAGKMGIPIILHESNSYPGVTTKMLSKLADTVCLPNEEAVARIPKEAHAVVTGNPIRADFFGYNKLDARKELELDNRPLILSLGGSLGAAHFNELLAGVFSRSFPTKKFQHIHSAGKLEYEEFCALMKEKDIPLNDQGMDIRPYIEDMARCMAAADLVICRCGAMTMGELLASGTPSILIPSPNVAENHQYYNAMSLVNKGAAVCVEEKDATDELLWTIIQELTTDRNKLDSMRQAALEAAKKDATEQIVDIIVNRVNNSN